MEVSVGDSYQTVSHFVKVESQNMKYGLYDLLIVTMEPENRRMLNGFNVDESENRRTLGDASTLPACIPRYTNGGCHPTHEFVCNPGYGCDLDGSFLAPILLHALFLGLTPAPSVTRAKNCHSAPPHRGFVRTVIL